MAERKLWGGRFRETEDELVESFTQSFLFDQILWRQDLAVLRAHVRMLIQTKILTKSIGDKILTALEEISHEIETGKLPLQGPYEDIHSFIEEALEKRIGKQASLIRLARSRNDTVVTDLRLFLKEECVKIQRLHYLYLKEWIDLGERFQNWVIPGYTHFRKAQPILFPFYTLAHFSAGMREHECLNLALGWIDVSSLGAGALSGTTWPISPSFSAKLLGFSSSFFNALDVVSDRDFLLAFYFASSLILTHISRWCEDFILWSSEGVGYLVLPDELCTGSSLMPQKKNPDPLELLRAKSSRLLGHLTSLFSLMKGLPMGYNRDLQEDKEPLFDAVNTMKSSLLMATRILKGVSLNKEALARSWQDDFVVATDFADELVKLGYSFSEAHDLAGKTVQYCDQKHKKLHDLSFDELQTLIPKWKDHILKDLSVEASANRRESLGGTGKKAVSKRVKEAKEWLKKNQPNSTRKGIKI